MYIMSRINKYRIRLSNFLIVCFAWNASMAKSLSHYQVVITLWYTIEYITFPISLVHSFDAFNSSVASHRTTRKQKRLPRLFQCHVPRTSRPAARRHFLLSGGPTRTNAAYWTKTVIQDCTCLSQKQGARAKAALAPSAR